jgi:hypothetical protein
LATAGHHPPNRKKAPVYVPTPDNDPDLHRLISLLAMLPGPDDLTFWNTVDRKGRPAEPGGEETEPTGNGYLLGKMKIGIANLLKRPVGDISYFCEYLLMFFDGDRPLLWKHLDNHVVGSGFTERAGERFAHDLCDTAWTIAVRYHKSGREELADKWTTSNHRR